MDTAGMTGVDTASFSLEVHSQEIETQGYTIIPGAISAERVRAAIAALEEIYQRERPIAEHLGEQTANQRVVRNVVAKHRFFETFFLSSPVLAVCRRLLGDDMVLYDMTGRSILPSGGREVRHGFQVHVDRELFSVLPFQSGAHFPVAVNVLWTLVDFLPENGATVIWPGSHLSLQVPDAEGEYPGYVQASPRPDRPSCGTQRPGTQRASTQATASGTQRSVFFSGAG